MNKWDEKQNITQLIDEYGNQHFLADELARGGQGVVFRSKDADLAIKQPLDKLGQPDKNTDLRNRFQTIRLLPMPPRIQVSLPMAILRDEPGYVMCLLNGMKPFSAFELDGKTEKNLDGQSLPTWLAGIPDKKMALTLLHYANTGSTRRRLFALAKCASILARLHSAGLVYGDISPNNAFIGDSEELKVWLIDADNMRYEKLRGGVTAYTPAYGAPEIVRNTDSARPSSDCWAFAVMVFKLLSLNHPFIGRKVLEPEEDAGGWDSEPAEEGAPEDLDEQAYAGYLPFLDDEDDDSNEGIGGLPRNLVATHEIQFLFQETFNAGRSHAYRRPAMFFWALELTKAYDYSLDCPNCKMSYFAETCDKCPYCSESRPAFIRAKTPRWKQLISAKTTETTLPHRLFYPFSFEHNDTSEYEVVLDFSKKTAIAARGEKALPDTLIFEFVEAEK